MQLMLQRAANLNSPSIILIWDLVLAFLNDKYFKKIKKREMICLRDILHNIFLFSYVGIWYYLLQKVPATLRWSNKT